MIVVGGVGELWQGDLDLGRRAVAVLADELGGPDVVVEDLSYGAVAVAQRLQELAPEVLVLVGATRRGRPPGTVEIRRPPVPALPPEELQLAVARAVTGYVGVDLLVDVAGALGGLAPETVVVEVEPATAGPGEHLSAPGARALAEVLDAVRAEVDARRQAAEPAPGVQPLS